MNNKIHVESVDYLRGILALLIIIYHYLSWNHLIIPNSNSILFRVALYGVSIFFIISGFSLTINYYKKDFLGYRNIVCFYKRRIARIYPLYWFVIILAVIIGYRNADLKSFLTQITLSFSFLHQSALTPGGWSIGVEMNFYLIFPILVIISYLIYIRSKILNGLLLIIAIIVCLYLSSFDNQYYIGMGNKYFKVYVDNFYNHFFFFLFGMLVAIYYRDFFSKIKINKNFYVFIWGVLIILFVVPKLAVNEYFIVLSRFWRIYFSILSFLMFIMFLYLPFKNKILKFFGEISYTLYLTHPITLYLINKLNIKFFNDKTLNVTLDMIIAIIIACLIYYLYEDPMRKLINNWRIYENR